MELKERNGLSKIYCFFLLSKVHAKLVVLIWLFGNWHKQNNSFISFRNTVSCLGMLGLNIFGVCLCMVKLQTINRY